MNLFKKNWDLIILPLAVTVLAGVLHFCHIAHVSVLEFAPVLLTMLAMMLLRRENNFGIFLALVGNACFLAYFIQINLPGQIYLAVAYLALYLSMLYFWMVPNKKTKKIIRPSYLPNWVEILIVLALIAAAVYGMHVRGTTGALDYLVAAGGLIGLLLLEKKKAEAWESYLISDVASIALFAMTGSYLILARQFVYIYNDISAIVKWRKNTPKK